MWARCSRVLHRLTQGVLAVDLEDLVEAVDVADPLAGTAMDHLGEVEQSALAEVEELLALEVALAALSGNRREHRRPVLGQDGVLSGNALARVGDVEGVGHDADAIAAGAAAPAPAPSAEPGSRSSRGTAAHRSPRSATARAARRGRSRHGNGAL
jgi:hypothetical protein